MMDVYWLEQTEADVPAQNDWLSVREAARFNALRFAKRRADWRLGRWTAKRALAVYLKLPSDWQTLATLEILPAPSGAPEVYLAAKLAAVAISLSHRSGVGVCAVTNSSTALGCDLEAIEPRSNAFLLDYFTTEEQELVAQADAASRSQLITLLWSGKESALKALHTGLRLDTRSVIVSGVAATQCRAEDEQDHTEWPGTSLRRPSDLNTWRPLQVRCTNAQVFQGWWQHTGSLLRTLVTAPPSAPPIALRSLLEPGACLYE